MTLQYLKQILCTGDSWSPFGILAEKQSTAAVAHPAGLPALGRMAQIATMCNEAHILHARVPDPATNAPKDDFSKTGESTEAALLVMAEKIGLPERKDCKDLFASNDGGRRASAVAGKTLGEGNVCHRRCNRNFGPCPHVVDGFQTSIVKTSRNFMSWSSTETVNRCRLW